MGDAARARPRDTDAANRGRRRGRGPGTRRSAPPLLSGGSRVRVTWSRPRRGGGWEVPGADLRQRGARPRRVRSVEVLGGYGARERAASGGDRCRRGLTRAAGSWSHVFHHSRGTCRGTRRRLGARAVSGGAEGVDTWVAGRPGRARTRGELGDLGGVRGRGQACQGLRAEGAWGVPSCAQPWCSGVDRLPGDGRGAGHLRHAGRRAVGLGSEASRAARRRRIGSYPSGVSRSPRNA